MIFGIGCDVCSISRLEKSFSGSSAARFAQRVYGASERSTLGLDTQPLRSHALQSAAADFAAKEAFLKAAGTGLREPFSLCEIEVLRQKSGAPYYAFSGKTAAWMEEHRLHAHLSLSHEADTALAFCILEQG